MGRRCRRTPDRDDVAAPSTRSASRACQRGAKGNDPRGMPPKPVGRIHLRCQVSERSSGYCPYLSDGEREGGYLLLPLPLACASRAVSVPAIAGAVFALAVEIRVVSERSEVSRTARRIVCLLTFPSEFPFRVFHSDVMAPNCPREIDRKSRRYLTRSPFGNDRLSSPNGQISVAILDRKSLPGAQVSEGRCRQILPLNSDPDRQQR